MLPALGLFAASRFYSLAHRFSRTLLLQIGFIFHRHYSGVPRSFWTTDVFTLLTSRYTSSLSRLRVFSCPRDAVVTSVAAPRFHRQRDRDPTGTAGKMRRHLLDAAALRHSKPSACLIFHLHVGLLSASSLSANRAPTQTHRCHTILASLRARHERIVASIRSGLVTTDLEGESTFNAAAEEIRVTKNLMCAARMLRSSWRVRGLIADSIDITEVPELTPSSKLIV